MEMAFCKCSARARLQISFERDSGLSFGKREVGHDPPRSKLGGMWRIATVVVDHALFQVGSIADILLLWVRLGFQEINIVHRSSESDLDGAGDLAGLPAIACVAAEGPPSPRLRRALQSSLGAALQAKAGAGDETRTRDVLLGKEVLYH